MLAGLISSIVPSFVNLHSMVRFLRPFRARRRWHSANADAEKRSKSLKTYGKILYISSKIHQQFNQNCGQERSESELESKSLPGVVFWRSNAIFCRTFGAIRSNLGAIWWPTGRQGGTKIKHFWHQEASNVGQMTSRKGYWKKLENLIEF